MNPSTPPTTNHTTTTTTLLSFTAYKFSTPLSSFLGESTRSFTQSIKSALLVQDSIPFITLPPPPTPRRRSVSFSSDVTSSSDSGSGSSPSSNISLLSKIPSLPSPPSTNWTLRHFTLTTRSNDQILSYYTIPSSSTQPRGTINLSNTLTSSRINPLPSNDDATASPTPYILQIESRTIDPLAPVTKWIVAFTRLDEMLHLHGKIERICLLRNVDESLIDEYYNSAVEKKIMCCKSTQTLTFNTTHDEPVRKTKKTKKTKNKLTLTSYHILVSTSSIVTLSFIAPYLYPYVDSGLLLIVFVAMCLVLVVEVFWYDDVRYDDDDDDSGCADNVYENRADDDGYEAINDDEEKEFEDRISPSIPLKHQKHPKIGTSTTSLSTPSPPSQHKTRTKVTWQSPLPPTTFPLRSNDYAISKLKFFPPDCTSLYDVIGVDAFTSQSGKHNITRTFEFPSSSGGSSVIEGVEGLPRFMTVLLVIPLSNGQVLNVPIYFQLNESYDSNIDGVNLFKRWFKVVRSCDGGVDDGRVERKEWMGRFKVFARRRVPDDDGGGDNVPSITSLSSYFNTVSRSLPSLSLSSLPPLSLPQLSLSEIPTFGIPGAITTMTSTMFKPLIDMYSDGSKPILIKRNGIIFSGFVGCQDGGGDDGGGEGEEEENDYLEFIVNFDNFPSLSKKILAYLASSPLSLDLGFAIEGREDGESEMLFGTVGLDVGYGDWVSESDLFG